MIFRKIKYLWTGFRSLAVIVIAPIIVVAYGSPSNSDNLNNVKLANTFKTITSENLVKDSNAVKDLFTSTVSANWKTYIAVLKSISTSKSAIACSLKLGTIDNTTGIFNLILILSLDGTSQSQNYVVQLTTIFAFLDSQIAIVQNRVTPTDLVTTHCHLKF